MKNTEKDKVALSGKNFALRGCCLKNTDWLIGVCVYTGSETKIMLNSTSSRSKKSRLELDMNTKIK